LEIPFSRITFNLLISVTSTKSPFSHFEQISFGPPSFVDIIGNPHEEASRRVKPKALLKLDLRINPLC
jgi:hypothetical protein